MLIGVGKVFLLKFLFHFFSRLYGSSRLVYSLYQGPVNPNWPCKSHPRKSNPTFLSKHIPIKVVIHVCHPVTKNLRVKNTVKCGRIYLNPTDFVIFTITISIGVLLSFISTVISRAFLFIFISNPSLIYKSWSSLRIRLNLIWHPYLYEQGDMFYHCEWACTICKCKCNTPITRMQNNPLNVTKCVHYMTKLNFFLTAS